MFEAAGDQDRGARRDAGRRILLILVIALLIVAVVEALFQLVLAPRMVIRNVEVASDVPVAREELLAVAGISGKQYYFTTDAEDVRRRLQALPLIGSARVEKVFPDTLRIMVVGRIPLAICVGQLGERSVPVAFDHEGMVFQIGDSVTDLNLPVVSGLQFTPILGITMPAILEPLLRDLRTLKEGSPELYRLISEIKVMAISEVDYELLFYPIGYPVRVRAGGRLDATFLRYAFMVLDVLARQSATASVAEIDMRSGRVVYAEPRTD